MSNTWDRGQELMQHILLGGVEEFWDKNNWTLLWALISKDSEGDWEYIPQWEMVHVGTDEEGKPTCWLTSMDKGIAEDVYKEHEEAIMVNLCQYTGWDAESLPGEDEIYTLAGDLLTKWAMRDNPQKLGRWVKALADQPTALGF